ncbi:MAG: GtrA family protein [bacterium]
MSEITSKIKEKIKDRMAVKSMTEYSVKYMAIGAIDCILDFILYFCLTRGFPFWRQHFLIANLIAFMVSDASVFDIERKWVFKLPVLPKDEQEAEKMNLSKNEENTIHIHYFKYLLVSFLAFTVNELGLFIFVAVFRVNDLIVKASMGIVIGLGRLFTHKFWTFRSKKISKQDRLPPVQTVNNKTIN